MSIPKNLVDELVDVTLADKLTRGSNRKVLWQCEHGHTWEATVKNRVNGSGCPYCTGKRAWLGETDLVTLKPDLAAELVINVFQKKHSSESVFVKMSPFYGTNLGQNLKRQREMVSFDAGILVS